MPSPSSSSSSTAPTHLPKERPNHPVAGAGKAPIDEGKQATRGAGELNKKEKEKAQKLREEEMDTLVMKKMMVDLTCGITAFFGGVILGVGAVHGWRTGRSDLMDRTDKVALGFFAVAALFKLLSSKRARELYEIRKEHEMAEMEEEEETIVQAATTVRSFCHWILLVFAADTASFSLLPSTDPQQ
ncbi:hypothetical protein JCM6882_008461 [Rhodosporidiobolus microsporus]